LIVSTAIAVGTSGRKVDIHTACFGRVALFESVVFLGQCADSGRWLLWWGEEGGVGGVWHDELMDAWATFLELTL